MPTSGVCVAPLGNPFAAALELVATHPLSSLQQPLPPPQPVSVANKACSGGPAPIDGSLRQPVDKLQLLADMVQGGSSTAARSAAKGDEGGDGGPSKSPPWRLESEEDRREALKVEAYVRQFEAQQAKVERKRKLKARHGRVIASTRRPRSLRRPEPPDRANISLYIERQPSTSSRQTRSRYRAWP